MKTSEAGFTLIRTYEGLRLEAYADPGTGSAPWTIGIGHTWGVKEGDTCTAEQADAWLREDVKRAESCVNTNVTVPMTQPEFDSLASLVFNIGCASFRFSTLLKKLNDSDYDGAQAEFSKWIHAGKRVLPGLVARRKAEAQMFASTDMGTRAA